MEASGTGNMKFALNGALTIGTLDGANVEIREAVGAGNIFTFGLDAQQVQDTRRRGYNPAEYYERDAELKAAIDTIASGRLCPQQPDLFAPIVDALLGQGDHYLVLADFRAYLDAQAQVERLYRHPDEWARRSVLNTANMGRFSSDRAVRQYAAQIWNVDPIEIDPIDR